MSRKIADQARLGEKDLSASLSTLAGEHRTLIDRLVSQRRDHAAKMLHARTAAANALRDVEHMTTAHIRRSNRDRLRRAALRAWRDHAVDTLLQLLAKSALVLKCAAVAHTRSALRTTVRMAAMAWASRAAAAAAAAARAQACREAHAWRACGRVLRLWRVWARGARMVRRSSHALRGLCVQSVCTRLVADVLAHWQRVAGRNGGGYGGVVGQGQVCWMWCSGAERVLEYLAYLRRRVEMANTLRVWVAQSSIGRRVREVELRATVKSGRSRMRRWWGRWVLFVGEHIRGRRWRVCLHVRVVQTFLVLYSLCLVLCLLLTRKMRVRSAVSPTATRHAHLPTPPSLRLSAKSARKGDAADCRSALRLLRAWRGSTLSASRRRRGLAQLHGRIRRACLAAACKYWAAWAAARRRARFVAAKITGRARRFALHRMMSTWWAAMTRGPPGLSGKEGGAACGHTADTDGGSVDVRPVSNVDATVARVGDNEDLERWRAMAEERERERDAAREAVAAAEAEGGRLRAENTAMMDKVRVLQTSMLGFGEVRKTEEKLEALQQALEEERRRREESERGRDESERARVAEKARMDEAEQMLARELERLVAQLEEERQEEQNRVAERERQRVTEAAAALKMVQEREDLLRKLAEAEDAHELVQEMLDIERAERARDRDVLVDEAGRSRSLQWRIMDGMERRREWRYGRHVLHLWRHWFERTIKARVLQVLLTRRRTWRLFLLWAEAAAAARKGAKTEEMKPWQGGEGDRLEGAVAQWMEVAAIGGHKNGVAVPPASIETGDGAGNVLVGENGESQEKITCLESRVARLRQRLAKYEELADSDADSEHSGDFTEGLGGDSGKDTPEEPKKQNTQDKQTMVKQTSRHARQAKEQDTQDKQTMVSLRDEDHMDVFEQGCLWLSARLGVGGQGLSVRAESDGSSLVKTCANFACSDRLCIALFFYGWRQYVLRHLAVIGVRSSCLAVADLWRCRWVLLKMRVRMLPLSLPPSFPPPSAPLTLHLGFVFSTHSYVYVFSLTIDPCVSILHSSNTVPRTYVNGGLSISLSLPTPALPSLPPFKQVAREMRAITSPACVAHTCALALRDTCHPRYGAFHGLLCLDTQP
jgi:hypothetical protein